MAVSYIYDNIVIRGITYKQYDQFECYESHSGKYTPEGGSSAINLTEGNIYYIYSQAIGDTDNVTHPYSISTAKSSSSIIGWYTEDVFPYATYTVAYNANGGNDAPSDQTKTYGTALTLSDTIPTRSGYTFLGWSTSSTAITATYSAGDNYTDDGDVTLYAVWEANLYTYNIVYESLSGIQLGTSTVTYNYGTTNTISPQSFTGYTSPSSQSIAWDSTSAKTITFVYDPISYSVTIDCNGGNGVNSTFYTIETETFSLGTPIMIGHTFLGWTGSNGETAQITVSISKGSYGDKSYVANWRANVLTVNYHVNKGSVNSDTYYVSNNLVYSISSSLVLEDNWDYNDTHTDGLYDATTFGLSREGYDFVGWSLNPSGTIIFDQNDTSIVPTDLTRDIETEDCAITLYAVWILSGVVYIDNGTALEPYLIYIDNGTNWDLYLACVDNGTSWTIIS